MIYQHINELTDAIDYFSKKTKSYRFLDNELTAYITAIEANDKFKRMIGVSGLLTERMKKKAYLAAIGSLLTWKRAQPYLITGISFLTGNRAGSPFVHAWPLILFLLMYMGAFFVVKGFANMGDYYWDKQIGKHTDNIVRTAGTLYAYYNGFYDTYGYECPLPSYQYCDPADLEMLRKHIISGASSTLERAREALYGSLHHYDRFLKEMNKHRRENAFAAESGAGSKPDPQEKPTPESGSYSAYGNTKPDEGQTETFFTKMDCRDAVSLKKAYRRLSKMYHPDIANGNHEKFVNMKMEYEKLLRELQGAA